MEPFLKTTGEEVTTLSSMSWESWIMSTSITWPVGTIPSLDGLKGHTTENLVSENSSNI